MEMVVVVEQVRDAAGNKHTKINVESTTYSRLDNPNAMNPLGV